MNLLRDKKLVSKEKKILYINLQQIIYKTIESIIFSTEVICKIINFCWNQNKAIVNWNVIFMIISSIMSLYFGEDNSLEYIVDKVNADWYSQCILEGSQLHSDLAIDLFLSVFTKKKSINWKDIFRLITECRSFRRCFSSFSYMR